MASTAAMSILPRNTRIKKLIAGDRTKGPAVQWDKVKRTPHNVRRLVFGRTGVIVFWYTKAGGVGKLTEFIRWPMELNANPEFIGRKPHMEVLSDPYVLSNIEEIIFCDAFDTTEFQFELASIKKSTKNFQRLAVVYALGCSLDDFASKVIPSIQGVFGDNILYAEPAIQSLVLFAQPGSPTWYKGSYLSPSEYPLDAPTGVLARHLAAVKERFEAGERAAKLEEAEKHTKQRIEEKKLAELSKDAERTKEDNAKLYKVAGESLFNKCTAFVTGLQASQSFFEGLTVIDKVYYGSYARNSGIGVIFKKYYDSVKAPEKLLAITDKLPKSAGFTMYSLIHYIDIDAIGQFAIDIGNTTAKETIDRLTLFLVRDAKVEFNKEKLLDLDSSVKLLSMLMGYFLNFWTATCYAVLVKKLTQFGSSAMELTVTRLGFTEFMYTDAIITLVNWMLGDTSTAKDCFDTIKPGAKMTGRVDSESLSTYGQYVLTMAQSV